MTDILFTHVEITSPGSLRDGRRFFVVDLVERHVRRCGMWSDSDYGEAILAAGDCAEDDLPMIDRVLDDLSS